MANFTSILVVADEEVTTSRLAFEQGIKIASACNADLTFMCVIDQPGRALTEYKGIFKPEELIEMRVSQAKDMLDNIAQAVQGVSVRTKISVGKGFIEIIRQVVTGRHDLVIKVANSTKSGFNSHDFHLMRKCPVPLWIHRSELEDREDDRPIKVLAAIDLNLEAEQEGRNLNSRILEFAKSISTLGATQLHLLSCWSVYGESTLRNSAFVSITDVELNNLIDREMQYNEACMSGLLERSGQINIKTHLIKGRPTEHIPRFAHENEIDTIVMGTVARSGIPGLLIGNTAETILSKISCAVVTLKPSGFESIIK